MTQKINLFFIALVSFIFIASTMNAYGQKGSKPQWVLKGESSLNAMRTNDSYYFKIVSNQGSNIETLKKNSINILSDYIVKTHQIEALSVTELSNTIASSSVKTSSNFKMEFKNHSTTDTFYAVLVDEYWEYTSTVSNNYAYQYFALYALSSNASTKPNFDHFEVSRTYGITPVVISLLPGAGQIYKGHNTKGYIMLGGATLGAGAIILCENRRNYYETRVIEYPKFARDYKKKADEWQTGRNIAIGATAAIILWSVLDAAITPGTTHIKISSHHSFAIRPASIISPNDISLGASLTLVF